MFAKLKDLVKTSEKINKIEENTEKNLNQTNFLNSEISKLKNEFEFVKNKLDYIKTSQTEFLREFKENIAKINETNEEFQKDLTDFKLIKGNIQGELIRKLTEEFRKEILTQVEKFREDAKSYNDLKQHVNTIAARTSSLTEEIRKFTEISKNIKSEDFRLNNVAKQISDADKEKLRLMKHVDMLERLLSKERRKAYQETIR